MADELRTVLGFEAAEAISTLAAMEAQLKTWSAAMRGAASATHKFNKEAAATSTNMANLSTKTKAMTGANVKAVSSQQNIADETEKLKKRIVELEKGVKASSKSMILSWQSVVRIFAIQTIHQIISKLTASLTEGASAARDYEIALAEIQTIAPPFRKDFEALSKEARNFSDAMGAPLELVTEGVYQTLSNQVAEAGEAFQFMTTAEAFAAAATTDTVSSVNLLSSIINSYNMNVTEAAEVGGKLAKTIELGRIRGEEFANTVGRITTLSSQLGVSLDEVLTSITVLTVSGMKWNEAFTLLTNIQLKLIRPTDALKERFMELGVVSAEAGIAAFGFQGFLDKITEGSGASASALGEMFNRVRAIRGALGLTNENAERYVENLKEIQMAGDEALKERKELIFKTNAKQVEIELNRLRNIMVVDFGRGLNRLGLAFFETFGGGVEAIKALITSTGVAAAVFLTLRFNAVPALNDIIKKLVATKVSAISFRAIWKSLAATPAIWAAAAAAATATFIWWMNRGKAAALELRNALERQAEGELADRLSTLQQAQKAQELHDKERLASTLQRLQAETIEYDRAMRRIKALETATFEGLTGQVESKTKALEGYFQKLEDVVKTADSKIKDLNRNIQMIQFDISDFVFEREIGKNIEPLRKAHLWMQRATELRKKATEAINKREYEIADAYTARAKSAAKNALQTADELGNKALIRKAEEAVQLAMQGQISVLQQKKQLTKDDAAAAEEALKGFTGQRAEVKGLSEDLTGLIEKLQEVGLDPDKVVQREKIKAAINVVAEDLQKRFDEMAAGVDLAKQLRLEEQFNEAVSGVIDPETGDRGKFTIILDLATDRFETKLKEAVGKLSPLQQQQVALFGAEAAPEQQKNAIELVNMLNKSAAAKLEIAGIESKISKETTLQAVKVANISNAYESALTWVDSLARSQNRVTKHLLETSAARKEATRVSTELAKASRETVLDLTKIAALQERLRSLRQEAAETGETEVVTNISAFLESINAIIEGKQSIAEIKMGDVYISDEDEAAIRAKWEAMNQQANTAQEELKAVGPAAKTGAEGVVSAGNTIINSLKEQEEAARARNAEMAKSGGAGKQFGGPIYRALGGMTPRGTDVVPAMLTPGEFVVNADASRKFFSQLVAINSGVKPQYHAEGGSVTTIGDINITVNETTSAKATARETIAAFRREKRRLTSRI